VHQLRSLPATRPERLRDVSPNVRRSGSDRIPKTSESARAPSELVAFGAWAAPVLVVVTTLALALSFIMAR
jgi:hypothetical protein